MMVPTGNLPRRSFDGYGGSYYGEVDDWSSVRSFRVHMGKAHGEEARGKEEAGTSSKGKEKEEEEEEWLRLSIGRNTSGDISSPERSKLKSLQVERSNQSEDNLHRSSLIVSENPRIQMYSHTQELRRGSFWSAQPSILAPPPHSQPYRAGQFSTGISVSTVQGQSSTTAMGIRVVSPPLRSYAGVWFLLQASKTQAREPFLPQIPKCYLRIKDGKMTVRLLMKYLVNKLSLNDESEVEIRCRGQQLDPLLTLQQVRDSIWYTRDTMQILPDPPGHHVMTLLYGRNVKSNSK